MVCRSPATKRWLWIQWLLVCVFRNARFYLSSLCVFSFALDCCFLLFSPCLHFSIYTYSFSPSYVPVCFFFCTGLLFPTPLSLPTFLNFYLLCSFSPFHVSLFFICFLLFSQFIFLSFTSYCLHTRLPPFLKALALIPSFLSCHVSSFLSNLLFFLSSSLYQQFLRPKKTTLLSVFLTFLPTLPRYSPPCFILLFSSSFLTSSPYPPSGLNMFSPSKLW